MFSLEALAEINDTAYLLSIGGGQEKDALAICTKPNHAEIRAASHIARVLLNAKRINLLQYRTKKI